MIIGTRHKIKVIKVHKVNSNLSSNRESGTSRKCQVTHVENKLQQTLI